MAKSGHTFIQWGTIINGVNEPTTPWWSHAYIELLCTLVPTPSWSMNVDNSPCFILTVPCAALGGWSLQL